MHVRAFDSTYIYRVTVTEGDTHISFQDIRFAKILEANLVDKTFKHISGWNSWILAQQMAANSEISTSHRIPINHHYYHLHLYYSYCQTSKYFLNITTSSALSCELMFLEKLHNCLVFHSSCLFINLYCQVFLAKSVLPCVTCHCLKWKTKIIAGIKIPPFLWYVIHFSALLLHQAICNMFMKSAFLLLLTPLTLPLPFPFTYNLLCWKCTTMPFSYPVSSLAYFTTPISNPMVQEILICWLHILFREQIIFNILTISTNTWNSEASFLSLQLYKNVLFHLRVALAGAETCSKLVLVIIFTHNK